MSGLVKPKKYDWKDSNLALFGSDTEKSVKKESAQGEPAWEGVGQEEGLKIWRIVKFEVTEWPKEDYGSFYTGDSYIILNTYKPDPDNEELAYDVHFWIGKASTQDEYGAAAYKTVELDTFLDDAAVQHREVQGRESDLFKSYFDHIMIMDGGAETGFRHVEPEQYPTRLFHFNGKRTKISITQVSLNRGALKSDDVYILDQGLELIQWNGAGASHMEKHKACEFLQVLKGERLGRAEATTVEQTDIDEGHAFYEALVGDLEDDDDDESPDIKELFKVSDASGDMSFSKVKDGSVSLVDFHGEDVYILDVGKAAYVWIGSGASPAEKRNAFGYAHKHLQSTNHALVPVCVIKEGQKNAEFEAALAA